MKSVTNSLFWHTKPELIMNIHAPRLSILFFALLLIDAVFIIAELNTYRIFSKSLLMPTLIVLIYSSIEYPNSKNKSIHLVALILSFLGDFFLQIGWFLPGLFSFLLAHLSYISLFVRLSDQELISRQNWVVLICILIGSSLSGRLVGIDHTMFFPVFIYSSVILCMFWFSANVTQPKFKIMWGAIIFIISDLVLAYNMFKGKIPFGGVIVMITYGTAQYLIAQGLIDKKGHKTLT